MNNKCNVLDNFTTIKSISVITKVKQKKNYIKNENSTR